MAKQAITKGAVAKGVRWTHLQEATFDDFFGKKLCYEGFIIERIPGGYQVLSNPTISSLTGQTVMVQKAELGKIVSRASAKR